MAAALYARSMETSRQVENPVASVLFHTILTQSNHQFAYDVERHEGRF